MCSTATAFNSLATSTKPTSSHSAKATDPTSRYDFHAESRCATLFELRWQYFAGLASFSTWHQCPNRVGLRLDIGDLRKERSVTDQPAGNPDSCTVTSCTCKPGCTYLHSTRATADNCALINSEIDERACLPGYQRHRFPGSRFFSWSGVHITHTHVRAYVCTCVWGREKTEVEFKEF
jgi:hypothetical protein